MGSRDEFLQNQPEGKLLFRLALPAVTAQIINVLYNVVDRIYIGHIPEIGSLALTGVGVCMPLIMLIAAFAALVSMGGAPRASIKMGEKNHEAAEAILGSSAVLLVVIALVLTLVFTLFGKQALLAFGASENTIAYAWSYMRIYTFGTLFVQLALGLNAFITAQGFATISMLTVLIGAVLNIILDPILIFGLGLGVQGAALATVFSQAVSAVWVVWFLSGKKTFLKLQKKHLRLRPKVFLPSIALGLSPFVMQATESVLFVCFNSSLLRYGGDLAVGSMAILGSVMQFTMLPLNGFAQGAQPIVSYNFGAKNTKRVKRTFKLLLASSLVYTGVVWLAVMLFPQVFALMFSKDAALVSYTTWALRIYMGTAILLGAQTACQQTFIAIGNAKTSLFLAVLRKIILLIPLIYILPLFIGNQVFAVFLAEPVADTIAVITTVSLFTVQFKKALAGGALHGRAIGENP